MKIKQLTDDVIQVGNKFYMESDEQDYYFPMEDVVLDDYGVPESYSLDISVHINEIKEVN